MKTRIGYYYANAVYTDEDANGLFHTRYGKLTSTNRGCTKIEILDVNIGDKYFGNYIQCSTKPVSVSFCKQSLAI